MYLYMFCWFWFLFLNLLDLEIWMEQMFDWGEHMTHFEVHLFVHMTQDQFKFLFTVFEFKIVVQSLTS
jgi:hypothetical protein